MSTYPEFVAAGRADERVLVHVARTGDGHAVVTLDDPPTLNALSVGLMLQLQDALHDLTADPAIRTVVITGADPAFSAGGDLRMIADGSRAIRDAAHDADTSDAWRWIRHQFGGVVRTIAGSDTAFVAAVNGAAAGVGLAFALACDVVLASDRAALVPAFGRLGLVPEVGTSWLLTRRLGPHAAMAFYVDGRPLDAQRALGLGLVQEVHAHDDLLGAADAWAARVRRMPQHAFAMTKTLLREAPDLTWQQSLAMEEFAEANCFSTASLATSADAIRRRAAG